MEAIEFSLYFTICYTRGREVYWQPLDLYLRPYIPSRYTSVIANYMMMTCMRCAA